MNNKLILGIVVIIILIFGILVIAKPENTGNNSSENSEDYRIQKITLSMKDYNYYPNTVKVKANQTVRIYLDKSVVGCYRSFTIRDFGISKYLETEKDYIEFTPTKKGSYKFACSMNMGTGTLIVE